MKIIINIVLTLSLFTLSAMGYAGFTNTIMSVPASGSGFSYSDGQGNSISINRTQNVPVVVNAYPNAIWIPMQNGALPPNAIIMQYVNGYPVYYCKVQRSDQTYYGQLLPNEGCSLYEQDNYVYKDYFVLSR